MSNKIEFNEIVFMGDSLTDRGTLNHRMLGHVVPMRRISELNGRSPLGRFTNGFTWSDDTIAKVANRLIISDLKKKYGMDSTDIADGIIHRDNRVVDPIAKNYNLRDDQGVTYKGQKFARNYSEGGLSSHSYKYVPSKSLSRLFSRLVLSTLGQMREKLFAYDKEHAISNEQKAKTLIIEWSGANDLMTVNEKPSIYEAKRAVSDRIDNAAKLLQSGYKSIVLFNIPDLSLTPRFNALTAIEKENAHHCSVYFNDQLAIKCQELKNANPGSNIILYDINKIFRDAYENPQKYAFDPAKIKTPYVSSAEFSIKADHTSPANGYMFWDDVHPSSKMHELLAERFDHDVLSQCTFTVPDKMLPIEKKQEHLSALELFNRFYHKYMQRYQSDLNGVLGFFRGSRLNLHLLNRKIPLASLKIILTHAFHESGARTHSVLVELGWIDGRGNIKSNNPVLTQVITEIKLHINNRDTDSTNKPQQAFKEIDKPSP